MEEVLGLYNALTWVVDLKLDNIDFTLSSKKIVDYFCEVSSNMTEFGSIMNFCEQLLNVSIQNSNLEFNQGKSLGR
jgi:hypothetical protein